MKRHLIEGREIVEEALLSEGAYGYIYKVRDARSGQIMALKKMFCQDKEKMQVGNNEIAILKSLPNHPNVVAYYGSSISRNEQGVMVVLILMEFCTGGSIFDLMAKNPNARLSESQILRIASEVTQGLKAMHLLSPPMAHRDIKIENILSHDGRYKLCDFGSSYGSCCIVYSKIDKADFYHYEEDYEKNTTLMYRPPEMADLFQRYEVCEKVDVWMLGCVLFTVCFFIHPFQESQKLAIVNATYNIPKTSQYSDKLHDLIRVMLTPNPKLRPSIFEVENLLVNFSSIKQIQLNVQAQEIKNRERVLEKEMEQYEKNANKIKKFDGDIPMDELIKLQERIKNETQSNRPVPKPKPQQQQPQQQHQRPQPQQQTSVGWGDFKQTPSTTNPRQDAFSGGWADFSKPVQSPAFDSWDGPALQPKPQLSQQASWPSTDWGFSAPTPVQPVPWQQPACNPTSAWAQPQAVQSQVVHAQPPVTMQPQMASPWAQQVSQPPQHVVSQPQVQEVNLIDIDVTPNQRIDLTNLVL